MTRFQLAALPRWLRDYVPLILWMSLIFWFSSQSVLVEIEGQANEKIFYKSSHIIAYAMLAWLWWRALTPQRRATGAILGIAFVLATLYGISDEVHQLFVPGRHGRLSDVLFDASGGLAAVLLIRQFRWLRRFPEEILDRSESTSETFPSRGETKVDGRTHA